MRTSPVSVRAKDCAACATLLIELRPRCTARRFRRADIDLRWSQHPPRHSPVVEAMGQDDHRGGEPVSAEVGALPGLFGMRPRGPRDRSTANGAALIVSGMGAHQQGGPDRRRCPRFRREGCRETRRGRRRSPLVIRGRAERPPLPTAIVVGSGARPPGGRTSGSRRAACPRLRRGARPRDRSRDRRDWKNAWVPQAPSISMSSQRAPNPPVPARGSPRSSERSLHGSQAPADRGRGKRARTHGGPLISPPAPPRGAASARPPATIPGIPGMHRQAGPGRAARAPRRKPPRED